MDPDLLVGLQQMADLLEYYSQGMVSDSPSFIFFLLPVSLLATFFLPYPVRGSLV